MKRLILSLTAACALLTVQVQHIATYSLKSCLEQGLMNNYS